MEMKAVSVFLRFVLTFPVLPHRVTNWRPPSWSGYGTCFTGCPPASLQAMCLWVPLPHQNCQQEVEAGVSNVKMLVLPELTRILLLYLSNVQKNSRSFNACRNGDAKGSRLCSLLLP